MSTRSRPTSHTGRATALAAVAVGILATGAPAAQGAAHRTCDGEAVTIAVRATTCLEGGRVYRSYVRSCVAKAGGKSRLTCRVRRYSCLFMAQSSSPKSGSKTEDVIGITTCSRGKRRVIFAVTRTVPVP